MGKAVARRSKKSIASECMKDAEIRKHILKIIGRIVHTKVKVLCSDAAQSVLHSHFTDGANLKSFSWHTLNSELTIHTPVLKNILESTVVTGKNKTNFESVVCLCVALLSRNRNPKMNR